MKRWKGGLSQKVSDGGKVNKNRVAMSGNNSHLHPSGDRKYLGMRVVLQLLAKMLHVDA